MISVLPQNIQSQIEKPDSICLDGFIRFVQPEKLMHFLQDGYVGADTAIPFATTAFGDILTWEKNKYICLISFVHSTVKIIESGSEFFLDDINDSSYAEKFFDISTYQAVKAKEGRLRDDECYGIVPLPALGGTENVESFKIVNYHEYLELVLQVMGKVS